jgi:hypothetical protein
MKTMNRAENIRSLDKIEADIESNDDELKSKVERVKNSLEQMTCFLNNGKGSKDDFVKLADALQKDLGELNFAINLLRRNF